MLDERDLDRDTQFLLGYLREMGWGCSLEAQLEADTGIEWLLIVAKLGTDEYTWAITDDGPLRGISTVYGGTVHARPRQWVGPCPICTTPTRRLEPVPGLGGRPIIPIMCQRCKQEARLDDGRSLGGLAREGHITHVRACENELNPVYVDGVKCWATFNEDRFFLALDDASGAQTWSEWRNPQFLRSYKSERHTGFLLLVSGAVIVAIGVYLMTLRLENPWYIFIIMSGATLVLGGQLTIRSARVSRELLNETEAAYWAAADQGSDTGA